MIVNNVVLRSFTPSEGKHLKNIKTGDIFEGTIFPAKSLVEKDFIEVNEEEYQNYINQNKEEEII